MRSGPGRSVGLEALLVEHELAEAGPAALHVRDQLGHLLDRLDLLAEELVCEHAQEGDMHPSDPTIQKLRTVGKVQRSGRASRAPEQIRSQRELLS